MEIYKLEELYSTDEEFVTDIGNAIMTYYGSTFTYNTSILIYELKCLYHWYIHNYTAYLGDTQADVKSSFKTRIVYDICDKYLTIEKKILHFISVNSDTLFRKGGLESDTTITPNLTSTIFTKQASTPSVVSQATDFVDDYTDYQSKSSSTRTGTDKHETELTRTGSQDEALKVLNALPKSVSDEMISAVSDNFFVTGDLIYA